MKRFRCKVAIESEYEIEIDDNGFEEDFMKNFRKSFFDFHDWSEHAAYIAEMRAFGDEFIEGYGVPLVDGKNPTYDKDESGLEKAINIKVIYEGHVDTDCDELNEE